MERPNLRRPSVIVTLVLGVALVTCLYWVFFGLPFSRTDKQQTAVRTAAEQASFVQDHWRQLPMTPLGTQEPPDAAGLNRIISSTSGLNAVMRSSLAKKVADELAARSRSPEEYIAFAEADPTTRWLVPADSQWATVDAWWQYAFEQTPPHADPKALMGEFLTDLYTKRKGRWAGHCSAAEGVRLFAFNVRQADEVIVRIEKALEEGGPGERELWLRATSARAVTFRVPVSGLDAVLRAHGTAQVALLMMIVQTEAGERFNWSSVLVWDPSQRTWSTESAARMGWTGTMWY